MHPLTHHTRHSHLGRIVVVAEDADYGVRDMLFWLGFNCVVALTSHALQSELLHVSRWMTIKLALTRRYICFKSEKCFDHKMLIKSTSCCCVICFYHLEQFNPEKHFSWPIERQTERSESFLGVIGPISPIDWVSIINLVSDFDVFHHVSVVLLATKVREHKWPVYTRCSLYAPFYMSLQCAPPSTWTLWRLFKAPRFWSLFLKCNQRQEQTRTSLMNSSDSNNRVDLSRHESPRRERKEKKVVCEDKHRVISFVVSVFAIINITRMFVLSFPNFGLE